MRLGFVLWGAGRGIVVLMFGDCGGLIVVWVAFIVLAIVTLVVGLIWLSGWVVWMCVFGGVWWFYAVFGWLFDYCRVVGLDGYVVLWWMFGLGWFWVFVDFVLDVYRVCV